MSELDDTDGDTGLCDLEGWDDWVGEAAEVEEAEVDTEKREEDVEGDFAKGAEEIADRDRFSLHTLTVPSSANTKRKGRMSLQFSTQKTQRMNKRKREERSSPEQDANLP